MSKKAVQLAQSRLDEGARRSAVSLDLQLDFVDERDNSVIARFGGVWNREVKDYVGTAETSRTIRLHPGQVDAAKWFDEWLGGHLEGNVPTSEKVFDLALTGGRRGGKSALGFSLAVAYAVTVPGAIVWVVAPSDAYFTEPMAYLESIMPSDWYTSLGWPHWTYFLPNGSTIQLVSGYTPGKLKQGEASFVLINEGQRVKDLSYLTLSASIVDNGGLIVTTANPPDVGDPGEWVADLVGGVESGERHHAVHFFFDPLDNPHIDQAALAALAEKMDSHTFNVQIRGLYLAHPDAALHAWQRLQNEKPAPELPGLDITPAFTKHYEGRPMNDIGGVDVQNYPWIVAVRLRAYRNPMAPNDPSEALLWVVGEVFIDRGDEVHAAKEMKAIGMNPKSTCLVTDASCEWQQQVRDPMKQRQNYKGKGSADIFRGEGFDYVVPPDPEMKDNPSVAERMRAANARIGAMKSPPLVFADPRRAPRTCESIRKWKTGPKGLPSRTSKHAHAGDAFTYPIWRFFPRRIDPGTVDVIPIRRFAGRDRMKGFTQ